MKKKKTSKLKTSINNLKKTSKGKAILKLIKWSIFFILIFILLIVSSIFNKDNKVMGNNIPNKENIKPENNNVDEHFKIETNTITIERLDKYITYLDKGYNYNYDINIGGIKYIYSGTISNNINTGYKETKEGIIKYIINAEGIFKSDLEEKIPITNLYENINENYLNPKYILNILKSLVITKVSDNNYEASDNINIYHITIEEDNLTNIIVTARDFSYVYNLKINY